MQKGSQTNWKERSSLQWIDEWYNYIFPCFTQLEGVDTGDFEAVNAAAFLLSTESSKTIFIAVKDDDLPEADETFTFNLTVQVNINCLFVCVCQLFHFVRNVCFSIEDDSLLSSHSPPKLPLHKVLLF